MAITVQSAEGTATKSGLKSYTELRMPTDFLQGLFKKELYDSLEIPIEIERDNDTIAVDVTRGTNGNLNESSVSTLKTIVPPEFHEKFVINHLSAYDRGFGAEASSPTARQTASLAKGIKTALIKDGNKIKRAIELQCGQALETGVVTLNTGDNINYDRKAASIKDNSGDPWHLSGADIEQQYIDAGDFIREVGGNTTGELDSIMSGVEFKNLKNTDYFSNNANFRRASLLDIKKPKLKKGANLMGFIVCGSYTVNLWVYDATYKNAAGARVRYFDAQKVIVVPTEGANFELAYGGIDAIIKSSGAGNVSGKRVVRKAAEFYVWDNVDENNANHYMHTKSAPIARLISVDQVYTMLVSNGGNPIVE